jgi:hypothetical protein
MPAAEAEAYISEFASKKIDSHDSTRTISQNRFFGESGPISSAGDLILASEAKDLVVTDGQLIEPGTPTGCWFGPSNRRTFFGRQSPCKSCAMRACSKLGRSKVPPLSTR